jgi:hypothetical protein
VLFGALGLGAACLPKAASAEGTCLAEPHALLADLGLHVVNVAYQTTLDCYAVLQARSFVPRARLARNVVLPDPLDRREFTAIRR